MIPRSVAIQQTNAKKKSWYNKNEDKPSIAEFHLVEINSNISGKGREGRGEEYSFTKRLLNLNNFYVWYKLDFGRLILVYPVWNNQNR